MCLGRHRKRRKTPLTTKSESGWVFDFVKSLFQPFSEESIVEWADGKLKLPQSVRYPVYLAEEAAWLIEPLRAISDPNVRRVDVRMPAGAAKSLIGEIFIAYIIENDPGFCYYVWQTDDDAKDAMEDRVIPMLEGNEVLMRKLPTDRQKKRIQKIVFYNMPLYAVGANKSAAQSKRVKYLIMEEPHLYEPGMMSAFEKRVEGVRNAKIITLSTGSVAEDDSDKTFCDGTCEEWEVPCLHCGKTQKLTDNKDRLRAERNEATIDKDGHFIWHKLLETVRYNCEHCGMDWPNTPEFRREQSVKALQYNSGGYKQTNPNAKPDHRSFHCEAASVHWIRLEDLVEEKLKSSLAAKRGALEPLRDYVQKRRALAWDDAPQEGEAEIDFNRIKGNYLKNDPHEGEVARFLTIDNQAGRASIGEGAHRWYVCRSFAQTECRLIDEGRITTWEELEQKRIALGVLPGRTLVDISWDTQNTQAVCVRYGWQGLWGDNTGKRSFPHYEISGNGQKIVRHYPFSSVQVGHVGHGMGGALRQARYFFWCQQPIKNMYHRLRSGLSTYRWTVPQNISEDYKRHTQAEYKKMSYDKNGNKIWTWVVAGRRANHELDCDQEALVAGLMDAKIRQILFSIDPDNAKIEEGEEVKETAEPI